MEFFGDRLFRSDLCNADVKLGDLLIHEGPAFYAQQHAARVYHADKTYFVLNGTSTANKIALQALLTPGDLILYDRNNHKSIDDGALIQLGAVPVYMETARNPLGSIGGIPDRCFDEGYLRKEAALRDPAKAASPRPFRLAVIQLAHTTALSITPAWWWTGSAIYVTIFYLIQPGSGMSSLSP